MGGIRLVKASVTSLDTDAVVNAANDRLLRGGGVCGCIFREAGADALTKELSVYSGGCPVGSAVITSGCSLKARYIIHAVGPVYKDGQSGEAELLRSAYTSSLELCKEHSLRSVAFPLISSGIYRYPVREAAAIAFDACTEFLSSGFCDIDIVFALIDDELFSLCASVLEKTGKGA